MVGGSVLPIVSRQQLSASEAALMCDLATLAGRLTTSSECSVTLAGRLPPSPESPIALSGGLPASPESSIALSGGLPTSPECPIVPAGGLPASPDTPTTLEGGLPAFSPPDVQRRAPRSNKPTDDRAKPIDKPIDIQQTAPPIGIDGAVGLSAITGSEAVWTTAEVLRTRYHG